MVRILVVRAQSEAETTAAVIEARGHAALLLPLQEIVMLATLPPAGDFAGFLATSANSVPALARHFPSDARPVLAVGPATAAALVEAGFANLTIGEGDGESLAGPAGQIFETVALPFLHAAGRVRVAGTREAFRAAGVPLVAWEVYDVRPLAPGPMEVETALGRRSPDAVLLLSAGQAESYGRLVMRVPDAFWPTPRLLCLSQRIADALPRELRGSAEISGSPSLSVLLDRVS